MEIVPYLSFNGRAAEAMKFYAKVLDAKIEEILTFGEVPDMGSECSAEMKHLVAHVRLNVGGQRLMASDTPADHYSTPQGTQVCLQIADPAEAERVFSGLSEGGQVVMPLSETFWAQKFGMLVDQFGTPWMVNCEKRERG